MSNKILAVLHAFTFLFAVSLSAPLLDAAVVKDAHTEVELIADVSAAAPERELRAGVVFRMEPEWHVYWKNAGDSGMAPKIEWELPAGASAGEIEWPAPVKIDLPPLSSYGYEQEVLLAAPVLVKNSAPGSSLILKAKVQWLACKIECVPGKADLELILPVKEKPAIHPETVGIFSKTRDRLPITESSWDIRAARLHESLELTLTPKTISFHALSSVYFFAENPELVKHSEEQKISKTAKGYRLQIPISLNAPQNLPRLKGVLISREGWRGEGSEPAWEIDIPFSAPAAATPETGFWTAVLFAFLGGLILNLMPCVLPVLSLKILGFVREASENPRSLWRHGLVFTAGVLVSFWILAALLFIFQATGRQIGWGFQLQSPWFVGFLCAVFFIFALNLFGLFEIGASLGGTGSGWIKKGGFTGTFAGGMLATVVATPCTAPFMGAALGFALTQPPFVIWIIFTSLALGMSAPYLILCANPKWLRFVPKPGIWMVRLKQFLGVLMLLTCFWLLWILGLQTGALQKLFPASYSQNAIAWEPYSEMRLQELRAQNRIVFIDFTAAWCLTCQVNERIALEIPKVREKFKVLNIAALKADWTNQDPEITRALAGYGRNSIPFYVLYGPGASTAPDFLPELLTPSIVLEALKTARLQDNED